MAKTPLRDDDINVRHANDTLRGIIADLLPLFVNANKYLLAALAIVFLADIALLLAGKISPTERIIDRTVIMAFIAATATEISVIILASIKKLR